MGREEIYTLGKIELPPFLTGEGVFEATLVDRVWGKHSNLICVFERDDRTLFSVTAWRQHADDSAPECYTPRKSDVDFSNVRNDTRWRCEFKMSRNRKFTVWMTADMI
ncbi:MAG: hypothetical protein R3Y68_10010 [Rikenellaceae bacterium]